MNSVNRRTFLKQLISTSSFALAPRFALSAVGPNYYEITAEATTHHFGPPGSAPSHLWLYNGTAPGPTLTATKGQELVVKFTNRLAQPTTIHWHGIRNLNAMDGVANLTQPPIKPGETFTYRFPVPDAGTFWYHAHHKSWEQVARGLYGPLIVQEAQNELNASDIVIVADDWRLLTDHQFDEASLGSLRDWSHQGRRGNWLTLNGQNIPHFHVPLGKIRLRFINAANGRVLAFQFDKAREFTVMALDGAPCAPFTLDTLKLGPAQRADIVLDYDETISALYEVNTGEPHRAAHLSPQTHNEGEAVSFSHTPPWYPLPDIRHAKIVPIHMQGGARGNLRSAFFHGEEKPLRDLARQNAKFWAFNGNIGSHHHPISDLMLGEVAILRVWNDTRWRHAMHLHGHHFWVKSKEFPGKERWVLRDTYLMTANEQADLIFIADNPGLWLFHCHMLEHHAAGMVGVIRIT